MKIVIAGLGVMGASLAIALKNSALNTEILGYDYPNVMDLALNKGIIDRKVENWPVIEKDVDIVFLATPISSIIKHLTEINGHVNKHTIVTDIGSTKDDILKLTQNIGFSGTYIGSHPMTGAEKSGLNAANPLMYENAIYILTAKEEPLYSIAMERLVPVLNAIKARIFFLDSVTHDKIMALISHLPQMIAVSLINLVGNENRELLHCFELAAGGFRDLTRIASSSPVMWQDIIDSNKAFLEEAMDGFNAQLIKTKEHFPAVSSTFNKAHSYRSQIPKKNKGFLSPLTDVLVYVTDQQGVIAKISNALFKENIDIRDIELLKIRENEGGVFMLSFENEQKAVNAIQILKRINFQAHLKE